MGSDDQMFDHWDEQRDKKLAELLGISYEELQQTTWELDEETSNDDLVLSLIVQFDRSSPKNILAKIKGINEHYQVFLPPYALGGDD